MACPFSVQFGGTVGRAPIWTADSRQVILIEAGHLLVICRCVYFIFNTVHCAFDNECEVCIYCEWNCYFVFSNSRLSLTFVSNFIYNFFLAVVRQFGASSSQ